MWHLKLISKFVWISGAVLGFESWGTHLKTVPLDPEGRWFNAIPLSSRSNGEMLSTAICEPPLPPCVCGRVCTVSPVSLHQEKRHLIIQAYFDYVNLSVLYGTYNLYARSRQRGASRMAEGAQSCGGIACPTVIFCL